jgi:hypothetical protein
VFSVKQKAGGAPAWRPKIGRPGRFPMIWLFVVQWPLAILPDSPAAAPRYSRGAEIAKGKKVFQQCRGRHSKESDEKRVGPSLTGFLGEPSFEMASL